MAINVSVQHNVGFLPGIILTVDQLLLPSGHPFKCYEKVLYLQSMVSPKRFGIFPPDWVMLRRSRCVPDFSLTNNLHAERARVTRASEVSRDVTMRQAP